MPTTSSYTPLPKDIWSLCYPSSQKDVLTEGELNIPVRRIDLSANEPPLHVYDASGPQGL